MRVTAGEESLDLLLTRLDSVLEEFRVIRDERRRGREGTAPEENAAPSPGSKSE